MKRIFEILILISLSGSPGLSGATTWHVEQDGSGDWFTIHAAVQAAADGDTILIGVGRWDDFFPTWSGAEGVVRWTTPKELYLIGSGVDSTIIGPEEYTQSSLYSVGLEYSGSSAQHFRGIKFENMDYGMGCGGAATEVENCSFEECQFALGVYYADSGLVRDCTFSFYRTSRGEDGLKLMGTHDVVVENCTFNDTGVNHNSSYGSTIRNCAFNHTHQDVAVSYASVGSGVFESNEVNGGTVFISLSGHVAIRDNVFGYNRNYGANVYVVDPWAVTEIFRNVFHGGDYAAIGLTGASLTGSDNHIFHEGGLAVRLHGYPDYYSANIDLRNNYWGTADPDSIASWIWDGNDDPSIQQVVQFEPFSTVLLPTEEQSLDSFKALFR